MRGILPEKWPIKTASHAVKTTTCLKLKVTFSHVRTASQSEKRDIMCIQKGSQRSGNNSLMTAQTYSATYVCCFLTQVVVGGCQLLHIYVCGPSRNEHNVVIADSESLLHEVSLDCVAGGAVTAAHTTLVLPR